MVRFARAGSILFLAIMILLPVHPGLAQGDTSEGPYYVIQEGDSLWEIANLFRVSMDDLTRANGISDPGQIALGAHLVIPGLNGIQGELTARRVAYGETLSSLSRRYQLPADILVRLNHLGSPRDLYAGAPLVLPAQVASLGETHRAMVVPSQSLFELAVLEGRTPWEYVLANGLPGAWSALPGDILHAAGGISETIPAASSALPEAIQAVDLSPVSMKQGKAEMIRVAGQPGMTLGGFLDAFRGYPVHFSPDPTYGYIGLQGVHAMTEPGLYTLVISGTLPSEAPYFGAPFAFSQAVVIRDGGYPFDPVLIVSPETIDPAVTAPEDAEWTALATPYTAQKLWQGAWQSPVPDIFKDCWPSLFGNRRSYNGSAYAYFHTGLDFCGGVGTEITAPAAGRVVFAGPLTVRGNATMIDHGWGIYSGYMHQSEILVQVGDMVEAGQLIGRVGGTGRVTGPHLHWEIWSGGVQVDPLDWLAAAIP